MTNATDASHDCGASGRARGCGTLARTTNVSHRRKRRRNPQGKSKKAKGKRVEIENSVAFIGKDESHAVFRLQRLMREALSAVSSFAFLQDWLPPDYLPTTRSVNEPGTMLGRGRGRSGVGAGGGPNSAVMRKILCFFGSSAIVRAPLCVGTFSRTVNLSGESSWTTVSVASPPFGLKARSVPGSNSAPSVPLPVGRVVNTFPLSALTTTNSLLEHAAKRRPCFLSIASPEGSLPGASGQLASTASLRESNSTNVLLSSRLT